MPLQRLGGPEEITWAAMFIASGQADFMTGETVYRERRPPRIED